MPATSRRLRVYHDFASALCYVAHRILGSLDQALGDLGVELEWRPIDLTCIAGWHRGVVLDGPRRARVQAIARSLLGPVHVPPVWLDSRWASAVSLVLGDGPREATWRERVWTAVFEEHRDPGDPRELMRLGRDIGIDVATLPTSLEAVAGETRTAQQCGVTAVPTLLLGDWPMAGIQDAETMLALLRRYVARQQDEQAG